MSEVLDHMLAALRDLEHAFANAGQPGCDIAAGPFADYALDLIRAAIAKAEPAPAGAVRGVISGPSCGSPRSRGIAAE